MKKSALPLQTDAEVAALYRSLRRVCDAHRLTIEQIFDDAFDPPFAYGTGYFDNFRKGKISRARAATLYEWQRKKHPSFADDLDAELGRVNPGAPASLWEEFIREHGVFGKVGIDRRGVWLPQHHGTEPLAPEQWGRDLCYQETTWLDRPFRFRFEEQLVGYLFALRWARGRWSGIELAESSLGLWLDENTWAIPPGSDSGPLPEDRAFQELDETGLHRFVFLVTDAARGQEIANALTAGDAIEPKVLNDLAVRLTEIRSEVPCVVRLLNVLFLPALLTKVGDGQLRNGER